MWLPTYVIYISFLSSWIQLLSAGLCMGIFFFCKIMVFFSHVLLVFCWYWNWVICFCIVFFFFVPISVHSFHYLFTAWSIFSFCLSIASCRRIEALLYGSVIFFFKNYLFLNLCRKKKKECTFNFWFLQNSTFLICTQLLISEIFFFLLCYKEFFFISACPPFTLRCR